MKAVMVMVLDLGDDESPEIEQTFRQRVNALSEEFKAEEPRVEKLWAGLEPDWRTQRILQLLDPKFPGGDGG
jgi:hypothetical protein